MRFIIRLLNGPKGRPLHPPLTDIVIGGYTIGTFAAVSSWQGWEPEAMAIVATGAISVSASIALLTALTGLADWSTIEKGSPARRLGLWHLAVILASGALYSAVGFRIYDGTLFNFAVEPVGGGTAILSIVAWLVLVVGAWLGGKLVFTHGVRVGETSS